MLFTDQRMRILTESTEQNDKNDLSFFENADELFTPSNGIYLDII